MSQKIKKGAESKTILKNIFKKVKVKLDFISVEKSQFQIGSKWDP